MGTFGIVMLIAVGLIVIFFAIGGVISLIENESNEEIIFGCLGILMVLGIIGGITWYFTH